MDDKCCYFELAAYYWKNGRAKEGVLHTCSCGQTWKKVRVGWIRVGREEVVNDIKDLMSEENNRHG